jgi:hypothetical protein
MRCCLEDWRSRRYDYDMYARSKGLVQGFVQNFV